jgi:hypothetical protein
VPRARSHPDGLPYLVYERFGVRTYSIGYRFRMGKWAFKYSCPVTDGREIAALRRKAILESQSISKDRPTGGFEGLVDAWFAMQDKLPPNDADKRAASTLQENRKEAARLKTAFGHFEPGELTATHAYEYLASCKATRPEKGNKEIALARRILEWGIAKGLLTINPFDHVHKNKTVKTKHLIAPHEMELAVKVGREWGGVKLIVAMALKTAWLCVKRPVEVRALTLEGITPGGLLWADGKSKTKPKVLIEWSDELRQTIDEVLVVKRNKDATGKYVFGNMQGKPYTKGGWKASLDSLMDECFVQAKKGGFTFRRFNLQDCRPLGVSDKLDRGDTDTMNATGHVSDKMIAMTYDRRPVRKATAAA